MLLIAIKLMSCEVSEGVTPTPDVTPVVCESGDMQLAAESPGVTIASLSVV
jgi:hypothetical protein